MAPFAPAHACVHYKAVAQARLLARWREAADTVMLDGSNPWEIDEAMVEFGFAFGPYEAQDREGLDLAYAARKREAATRDPARRYILIADRMVEEGRLGRKVGVGWYRYPGGAGKVIDPLVEDMAREEARFAGVKRRDYSPGEIRRRLLLALLNEAADLLEEGVAAGPAEIDAAAQALGFPPARGGLMQLAQDWGTRDILAGLESLQREDPVAWRASPRLLRLAHEGATPGGAGG